MAQHGNIYSFLYQSDSDIEEAGIKQDGNIEVCIENETDIAGPDFIEELTIHGALDDDNEVDTNQNMNDEKSDNSESASTPILKINPPFLERITHMCWRTETIYQAIPRLDRDVVEIIAAYAAHTEVERFICVLEDISRRGFNNLLIDAGFKYFETSLRLEWLGGPELPYDCKQYMFCVKCANSGRELCIDGALEDVLPSKKHLFGLTRYADIKKENRKLRTAYRIKMAELFMRY